MSVSQLQAIKELNESLYEEVISPSNLGYSLLRSYKGKGSHIINTKLRKENHNFELIEALINKILNDDFKRPQNNILYRNDSVLDSIVAINWFKEHINQIICFPSFLSSYSNIKDVPFKNRCFEIHLHLEKSNAFDISQFKKNTENEVLFKSRTSFKITSVIDEIVTLEETKETPAITLYENLGCYDPKFREGHKENNNTISLLDSKDF